MTKKITKISSFFLGFCLLICSLCYPRIDADDGITARTRQLEGTDANAASSEDNNQKSTAELVSEDNPSAVEPIREVLQDDDDSEVQPKTVPNVESQNAADVEDIKQTQRPDEETLSQKPLSDPPKENQEIPSRKRNGADSSSENLPPTDSALSPQHLQKDHEKNPTIDPSTQTSDTVDPPPERSSENQILKKENLDGSDATLDKKGDPTTAESNEDAEKSDSAEKAEAAGNEKAEDFPSYTEWTKKVLAEEKNKQDDQGKASSSLPQKQKMRNNYASADCGAKIVLANPEAENTKFILNGNPDEYMINPCQAKKWFIVELCETIQIKNIETASLELFSSRPKSFRFSFSDRYPSKEWQEFGTFDSTEERTVHKYQIAEDNYAKFIKVDILNHYGGEHFCPLTLFRVFGFTIEEDIDGEPSSSPSADDEDDDVQNESPPNLFNSAKDTVLRLVKHVLTTTNEQAGKDGTQTGIETAKEQTENITTATNESNTAVHPPNVTIACKGEDCQNITQKNATTNATSSPCIPEASDQRPVATATPITTLPIQPEEPQGSIKLMTNATVEYPDENLVTKLEDYEQVPVSSEEEPIVQLISCDEQLPLFTAHASACMYCTLRKKKTSVKKSPLKQLAPLPKCLIRPSHTTKCQFLRIISDIYFKKLQEVSDSLSRQGASTRSTITIIAASSSTSSSSSSSSWSVVKEMETVVTQTSDSPETDATLPSLDKSVSDPTRNDVTSLEPSSDVHRTASSETANRMDENKVFATLESLEKGESVTVSATLATSEEQKANLTTQYSDVSSASITSSQLASSVDSSASSSSSSSEKNIDFRTPAGTIYIEPSSTSIKELPLQHAMSSDRPPVDPLSRNLTPTSSLLPDNQGKQVASSIKSDIKEDEAPPESNIITTASLPPANGEHMEPAAANIEPTRVSESPSKVTPPESVSVAAPVLKQDHKVSQPDPEKDAAPDSKGRPLYTLVRVGLPPAVKRESAIMRLNNRIKALELNVSLSSRFLDELSQRYRKQSEEMMNFLNRTVARLRNATKKTEETVQRHEVHLNILEARLDNLTQAVSKLSDNMDELTRHLTDRQMVWASIEMAILTLIFVVCLKKRQPSLPPTLVAKVLEELLQTQNSSHSRRRNSDSEVLQLTPNHREVVRQRSADDLACPKSVDIVEPGIPFLLGQIMFDQERIRTVSGPSYERKAPETTKEGHKKKKRKKNKSVDLKMSQVSDPSKSSVVLPAHRSVSTTQLNSAGLLFLGLPEDSTSPTSGDSSTPSNTTTTSLSLSSSRSLKEPESTPSKSGRAAGHSSTNSKSDPDLYSPYQPVVLPPRHIPPFPPPQDHDLPVNNSVMTTNSTLSSFLPPTTAVTTTTTTTATTIASVALSTQNKSGPIPLVQGKGGPTIAPSQAKSSSLTKGYPHHHHHHPQHPHQHHPHHYHQVPVSAAAVTVGGRNQHHGTLRHSASLPEERTPVTSGESARGARAASTSIRPATTITASESSSPSVIRNRLKTLNVAQKNYSDRKNLGRCPTNPIQCAGFRKS